MVVLKPANRFSYTKGTLRIYKRQVFLGARKLFSKKILSCGKLSKHYTSRVVYILSFSPYPASLSLIINKNTQQDTTKILNKIPQKYSIKCHKNTQ
jgi:hypothetical protein